MIINNELSHHGILGQKWGLRRYQRPDGSLTPAGERRRERRDTKWAQTKGEKIRAKTQEASRKDMVKFVQNELNAAFKTNGKLTSETILRYNNKLSEIMNNRVGDIRAPSGKVLRFVAKRGEIGVHTALADAGYDMSQLRRGVFESGKVAFKKENLKHSNLIHYGVLGMKWGVRKDRVGLSRLDRQLSEEERSNLKNMNILIRNVVKKNVIKFNTHIDKTVGQKRIESFEELEKLKTIKNESFDDTVSAINKKANDITKMVNCTNCVVAYDLRKRGYDVSAMPLALPRAYGSSATMYKNFESKNLEGSLATISNIKKEVFQWPVGSTGIIELQTTKGMGHIMNVVNDSGRVRFVDVQVNNNDVEKIKSHMLNSIDMKSITIGRVDNLELSERALETVKKGRD